MKKQLVLISAVLLLQTAFTSVFAQQFMECDYEESLIEVVPDSFICGYTFCPTGHKPYGMFLQKDSEGYQMLLNYYKYDRDKVDSEMSSATIRLSEWDVQSKLDQIIGSVEQKIEGGAKRGQWLASADEEEPSAVIKALMPGRAAISFDEFCDGCWYDYYYDFKIALGPEPHPNADRWEVTPYSNLSDYPNHAWIYSDVLSHPYLYVSPGQSIGGCVYVDHWGTQDCVVEEIDRRGKVVNSTLTDERGLFRLSIKNPDNSIRISYKRFDPERNAYVVYKPYIKEISKNGHTGSLSHYVELNESTYKRQGRSGTKWK